MVDEKNCFIPALLFGHLWTGMDPKAASEIPDHIQNSKETSDTVMYVREAEGDARREGLI